MDKYMIFFKKQNKTKNRQKAFTLIELLIAVAIFAIVVLIAIGALLNLIRVNNRAQALLTALENMDFAMENMSRVMRLGDRIDCDANFPNPLPRNSCTGFPSEISFRDADGNDILFKLENGAIIRQRVVDSEIEPALAITAPEVVIEDLSFKVVGTLREGDGGGDRTQPRVMILVSGFTDVPGLKEDEQTDFRLQTTIVQRKPDFYDPNDD